MRVFLNLVWSVPIKATVTTRRRLRFLLPLPLLFVGAVAIPLDPFGDGQSPGEVAYRALPERPPGQDEPGRSGVERSALSLAAWLGAVPAGAGVDEPCPADLLRVGWQEPGPAYEHGAVTLPVGPAPTSATRDVNGVVVCTGSDYGFMGFEASYRAGRWDVVAVPFVDEGDHAEHDDSHDQLQHAQAPPVAAPHSGSSSTRAAAQDPVRLVAGASFGAAIEGYAPYEPQRTCDPTAKAGTSSLRNVLLQGNPGTRNLGIVRGCAVGGQSEHKEGRAFDWGVLVARAGEKAAAERFIAQLMATDEHGNRHALARRMGVMYVIWNRQIWSAYRADAGWRPYSGRSPHVDHVHVSLSWAGALARTSFWTNGKVAQSLLAAPVSFGGGGGPSSPPATALAVHRDGGGGAGAAPDDEREHAEQHHGEGRARGGGAGRAGAEEHEHDDAPEHAEAERETREEADGERRGERSARGEAARAAAAERRAEREAARAAEREAERAAKAAREAQREAERRAEEEAVRAAEEAAEQERVARWLREAAAREAAAEAEREAARQRQAAAPRSRGEGTGRRREAPPPARATVSPAPAPAAPAASSEDRGRGRQRDEGGGRGGGERGGARQPGGGNPNGKR